MSPKQWLDVAIDSTVRSYVAGPMEKTRDKRTFLGYTLQWKCPSGQGHSGKLRCRAHRTDVCDRDMTSTLEKGKGGDVSALGHVSEEQITSTVYITQKSIWKFKFLTF